MTAGLGQAEIIDRVAVVVADRIVTQSEILLQMRVAAFLDGEPVDLSAARRRQAAERLIEQMLVRREIELSRYPVPDLPEADALLAKIRKQEPRLSAGESFRAELARYEIGEEDVRQQLLWQLTLLRFVEYRFRPAVAPSEDDLKGYYDKQYVPRWKQLSTQPVPSYEDSRAEIEATVSGRLLDDALERWLKQARAQARIRFREEVFR
ncbi:MAG: hypothetical protein HY822_06860 [Acidobacteria bacterium]|nr:hypothetical protein [Acidobacteriota bacterium]